MNDNLVVRKETLHETIERHRRYAGYAQQVYEAYEKSKDVDRYLDSVNTSPSGFMNRIPVAMRKAVQLANENTDPVDYRNETSRSLNPLSINIDPEFQWSDKDVITPLYRAGQLLRSDTRKKQDKLASLGKSQSSIQIQREDATGFVTKDADGKRYNTVP